MRRVFTFYNLLKIIALSILAVIGGATGSRFGILGLILGTVLGAGFGSYLGTLIQIMSCRSLCQRVADTSSKDLHALLGQTINPRYPPNFVLLELKRRGEVTLSDLMPIFYFLESDDVEERRCGVAAITSAFPEVAKKAPDYRLDDTTEECIRKVKLLRELAQELLSKDPAECGNS